MQGAGGLLNADIGGSAAIAYSKLNLALSILNADINSAAAIAYSKLALANSVVNADIAAAAAIAIAKLADPGSGNVVGSLGAGAVALKPPGTQLDYVQITADTTFTGASSAAATTIITGTSQAYDGTAVWLEFGAPRVISGTTAFGISLYDGVTELGILAQSTPGLNIPIPVTRRVRFTPTAATHQYIIKAFVDGGTGTVGAGVGTIGVRDPAYLLVTKA